MEVVAIEKILVRNLVIYIYLHCVRRLSWSATTLDTLTYLANYEMHKIFAVLSKSNMHCNYSGVSSLGVPGVPWHPQILADQLKLSWPWWGWGQVIPTKKYWHPWIFRPSYGPASITVVSQQFHEIFWNYIFWKTKTWKFLVACIIA